MERHIDAFEGYRSKSTLQVDRLGLGFRLLGAFTDDLDEVGCDVLEGKLLHQGLNVHLLSL